MSLFKSDISAGDVERRVLGTLQYWLEAYLQDREIALGRARDSVQRPKTWRRVNEFDDKNPEDQTPFVAVISDGLARQPVQNGEGGFLATWTIGIGVIIEASTEQAAQDLVKDVYLPVVRKIMLQKQSLKNWAGLAINERQTIRVTGTGGTFTLSFNGQVTGAIAYNASAAAIANALIALSNIGPADVLLTGGPVNAADVTVEFVGALGGANQPQMVSSGALLTGPGAGVVVATPREGAIAGDSMADEPWATAVHWVDEGYTDLAADAERTLFNGQLEFEVSVDLVVDRFGGPSSPADPVTQPGTDWPTALTGDVKLQKMV